MTIKQAKALKFGDKVSMGSIHGIVMYIVPETLSIFMIWWTEDAPTQMMIHRKNEISEFRAGWGRKGKS